MQLIVNALIAGSLAALIAGGLSLVYGTLRVFNMALGQMVLLGGYATWFLYQQIKLPLPISMLGGLLFGAFVSWIIFEIFIRPFYKYHRFLPIVTTIALSMILDGVILYVFKEIPRSILQGSKQTYQILGAYISMEQIIMVGATLIGLVSFAYILHHTSFGRRIRAVVSNDHAAVSVGIPARNLHAAIFILSGVLAAAGGIYLGIDTSLTPTLAFPMTIAAYAAIIAGGKGNFWGAISCAYLIALLERLAVGIEWFNGFTIQAGYQRSIALLIMIIFLLLRPNGLLSRSLRHD